MLAAICALAMALALMPAVAGAEETSPGGEAAPAGGERQYPFVCTTEGMGLGQPEVDNQEGLGVAVYEEDAEGEPIRDEEHIVGFSRDCELAEAQYDYFYVDTEGDRHHLLTWGDEVPDKPGDVAITETTEGEVEFFIRQERGTINRFVYSVTMLVPWEEIADGTPTEPNHDSWSGRLTFSFTAGGAGIGHSQGSFSDSDAFLIFRGNGGIEDVDSLSRGHAVITSSGLRTGTHYNLEVGAETAEQVKQHFVATHGEPEYTVGIGSSGGGIQQYVYGEHSPGLVDAIVPVRAYPDMTTQTIHIGDCELLERYMDIDAAENPELWNGFFDDWDNRKLLQGLNTIEGFVEDFPGSTAAQLAPLTGQTGSSECIEGWRGSTPVHINPVFTTVGGLDRITEGVDDVHWTHFDDAKSVYGVDPDTGYARVPWDNVGVQYGLAALRDGEITAAQFLDANARVGSWKESEEMVDEGFPYRGSVEDVLDGTVEFDPWSARNANLSPDEGVTPAPRREGDLTAIANVYESGLFFSGAIEIPVIDARQYLESELDMHNSVQSFAARQRMQAAMGHADHQAIWYFGDRRSAESQLWHAFEVIDEWLANIDAGADVVDARPDAAVDTCWDNDGEVIASGDGVWAGVLDDAQDGACTEVYPPFTTSRIEAGGPHSGDVYKCHTMPVDTAVAEGLYGDWTPNADERARLREIHPDGVCDNELAGVGDPRSEVPGSPDARVSGTRIQAIGAAPGAEVELRRGGEVLETRRANPAGRTTFAGLEPGAYVLAQRVDGHRSVLTEPVEVAAPGPQRGAGR